MSVLRLLLFPFAVLYNGVTSLRNHLYNIGNKRSIQFDRMVISVGNLNAGGSGKTPMTEYLVQLLKPNYTLAILSRGYGRKTRGLRFAGTEDSARTLGDEPYQYYRKFGEKILITVAEDRAYAIPEILMNKPETDVILLDDAYQHRSVKPQFSILLTEYSRPFFKDYVLPMGMLRESRKGARRADVIVVTKCPEISKEGEEKIKKSIRRYAPGKPVFFSKISYGKPEPINVDEWKGSSQTVLVSGIASSDIFESYARSKFEVVHHFKFPDHHNYSKENINQIHNFCSGKPLSILTTEKDMVKLIAFKNELAPLPWFYIPIKTTLEENGAEFDSFILKAISNQS